MFLFGREAARLSRTHTCGAVRGSVLPKPLNWRLFEGRGLSREFANIRTALLALQTTVYLRPMSTCLSCVRFTDSPRCAPPRGPGCAVLRRSAVRRKRRRNRTSRGKFQSCTVVLPERAGNVSARSPLYILPCYITLVTLRCGLISRPRLAPWPLGAP